MASTREGRPSRARAGARNRDPVFFLLDPPSRPARVRRTGRRPQEFRARETRRRSRGFRNELLYTGRRSDPETGLQLNRHRFYHQQLGRWVSRDPIGYEGGSFSLYEYAASSPILSGDPFGLISVPEALRACASEPTLVLKVKCICSLLPESRLCARLQDGREHLEKLKEGIEGLGDLTDEMRKASGKKKGELLKKIDDVINGKEGIKGHCREIAQKWCRNKGEYADDFCEQVLETCKDYKGICKYFERQLKK